MGNFKRIDTPIEGLYVVEPTLFGDDRGFFMETYSKCGFQEIGIDNEFVQDNHSKSSKGVLRGLHFQTMHTQSKLVRVTSGAVLDVAVDLRPESLTFGKYFAIELTEKNRKMLHIPRRFAHGFLTLEDNTEFLYKCDDYYCPEGDCGVIWNDQTIAIDWQLDKYGISENMLNISAKDLNHKMLMELNFKELWK